MKNADGTTNWIKTNAALAQVLNGQAAASVDNISGKIHALTTRIEDNVAEFGQKWGPAITAAGAGMLVMAPILSGAGKALGALKSHFGAAGKAATSAAEETAAADDTIVAENEAAAASAGELSAAQGASKLAIGGATLGLAAFAVAAEVGGRKLGEYLERNNSMVKVLGNLRQTTDDYRDSLLQTNGAVNESIRLDVGKQLQDNGLAGKAEAAGISLKQLQGAVTGSDSAFGKLVNTWKSSGKPSDDTITALALMHKSFGQARTDASKLALAQADVNKRTAAQPGEFGKSADAINAAKASIAKATAASRANTLQMHLENDAADLLSQAFDKLNGKTLARRTRTSPRRMPWPR